MRLVSRVSRLSLFVLLVLSLSVPAFAHGHDRPEKKGILLAAFGTTVPEALAAMDNIERLTKKAFPNVPVRWAYSSNIVRAKLAKSGKIISSPAEALAAMMAEGFTRVAVQSLHTIPGWEFTNMEKTAKAFEGMPKGFEQVEVGAPLLWTTDDVQKAAEILLTCIPKERKPGEAVVFMGHGTDHPGGIYYPGIQYYLWEKDPNVFVGTVEGSPTLDDVVAALASKKLKKAYLLPFMSVAGDHARNDMAGEEDDSWVNVLKKAGVTSVPVLKGTGEIDALAGIWIDHLKAAFERLK